MKIALTSDNIAGASESVVQALIEASQGDAMPYGNDETSAELVQMFSELFECELDVFLVSTGTAANVLSLSVMAPPWGAVLCHPESHINNDECSAPEFYTGGARLIPVLGENGKIDPVNLANMVKRKRGDVHSCQPSAVSISQVTEVGSVYSLDEIRAITDIAKSAGLPVHMDGARFANALVSLGCSPAEMTWKAGVDIVSFGATKNGVMGAEAIIVFNKKYAADMGFRRKRGGHLHSKMRLLSAQMKAYLMDDLWYENAKHANAMAARLQNGLKTVPGVEIETPADANILFCKLPTAMIQYLLAEGFAFYGDRWGEGVVRLVTSFRTPQDGIDAFVATAHEFADNHIE